MMRQFAPVIAIAGQTEFEVPGGYVPRSIIVIVNGVILQSADWSRVDENTIRLIAPVSEGDEVGLIVWSRIGDGAQCAD